MNVDHYFTIGSAHQTQGRPCEDYALSGVNPQGLAFGVVCDGCSGANANTDVGARALAWAYERTISSLAPHATETFGSPSFTAALSTAFFSNQFTSRYADNYATLVAFVATPQRATVLAHGDGAVMLRYLDGRMALIELEWLNSMPFYLNYHLDPATLAEFLEPYAEIGAEPFTQRTTLFVSKEDALEVVSVSELKFSAQELMVGHLLQFAPADEGIACLSVVSDGVAQVGGKTSVEVAGEFLSFKTRQGEFVKRRLMRAFKDFAKAGITPGDDVGMSAVWFDGAK